MSTIKIFLTPEQEDEKEEFISSFVENCEEVGISKELLDELTPIVETAFLNGVISERNKTKEICPN